MELFEKNKKFLQETYEYVKIDDNPDGETNVLVEENIHGEKCLAVEKDGYIWRFDSLYFPEEAARCWCNQFKDVNYRTIFVIIGLGNGEQIKVLNEQYPDNVKIVCEPDQKLFVELLKIKDISEILNNNTMIIAGTRCSSNFVEIIDKLINYDNKEEVKVSFISNYVNINKDMCIDYREYYKNRIERLVICRNTAIVDEKSRAQNYLKNITLYPDCSSIGQLLQTFEKEKIEDRIAVVVAAGPSLDKNIHLLKQMKNKAFIIGVDTALKSIIASGVKPDMAIIIDPEKDPKLFEDDIISNLPLSVNIHANNEVLKNQEGRLFFAGADKEFLKNVSIKFKKTLEVIYSGGSVSTNAFALCALLGFKTIVLMGQDLAYPNGQIHAKDAYTDEEKIDMSQRYFEVEDIYGGKVYTEGNMDMYRKWYEEIIASNPSITVIDATEGGAKIHGSQIMTLQEVIDKYTKDSTAMNFEEMIRQIPKLYTDEEKEELLKYYDSIEDELDDLKKQLEETIDEYEQLIELEKNDKLGEKDYIECANNLIESNKKIEKNVFLEWCKLYNNYIDYNVLEEMNDKENSEESETLKAARGGKTVCEVYIKSLDKVLEEWKEIYDEYNTNNRKGKME